jgi:hypothetical protein
MATIAEILDGHVTLELECVDRLYLNGYVPSLATPGWVGGWVGDRWVGGWVTGACRFQKG